MSDSPNAELSSLVQRNAELRELLQGRLPPRIMWRWQAYLAATEHFTAQQHGVYVLLLHYAIRKGGLPVEPAKLARIAKLPANTFAQEWEVIGEKFVQLEGAWYNETLEQEFNIAAEKQLKQSAGGRVGGQRSGVARRQDAEPYT